MPARKTTTKMFQCSVEGCGRYFKSITLRSEHDKKQHAALVKCPRLGCKLSLRPAFLTQHLFLHDKIHDLAECDRKKVHATKCKKPVVQNSTVSDICQRIEKKIHQIDEEDHHNLRKESRQPLDGETKEPDVMKDLNLRMESSNEGEKVLNPKKESVSEKLRIKDCQIIQKPLTQHDNSTNSINGLYYKIIKIKNLSEEPKILKSKPKKIPKICKKKVFQSNQKVPLVIKRGSYELRLSIDKNKLRHTPVQNNIQSCDRVIKHPIQQLRCSNEIKENLFSIPRNVAETRLLEPLAMKEKRNERPK